ncbi:hypothetical protein BU17DRAFT_85255 [Hysterangium stoloniferum]|nr:hypothetical protein BU17DRAFT_85255 [Hysterangium stoloniferum]
MSSPHIFQVLYPEQASRIGLPDCMPSPSSVFLTPPYPPQLRFAPPHAYNPMAHPHEMCSYSKGKVFPAPLYSCYNPPFDYEESSGTPMSAFSPCPFQVSITVASLYDATARPFESCLYSEVFCGVSRPAVGAHAMHSHPQDEAPPTLSPLYSYPPQRHPIAPPPSPTAWSVGLPPSMYGTISTVMLPAQHPNLSSGARP